VSGHNRRGQGSYLYLWHPKGRKPRWVVDGRDGRTYFARIVMAAHLGRELLPGEVVDHINGDSVDDRIENLILFTSHSEHMKDEYQRGTLVVGSGISGG
jgi:hypothetical protein